MWFHQWHHSIRRISSHSQTLWVAARLHRQHLLFLSSVPYIPLREFSASSFQSPGGKTTHDAAGLNTMFCRYGIQYVPQHIILRAVTEFSNLKM